MPKKKSQRSRNSSPEKPAETGLESNNKMNSHEHIFQQMQEMFVDQIDAEVIHMVLCEADWKVDAALDTLFTLATSSPGNKNMTKKLDLQSVASTLSTPSSSQASTPSRNQVSQLDTFTPETSTVNYVPEPGYFDPGRNVVILSSDDSATSVDGQELINNLNKLTGAGDENLSFQEMYNLSKVELEYEINTKVTESIRTSTDRATDQSDLSFAEIYNLTTDELAEEKDQSGKTHFTMNSGKHITTNAESSKLQGNTYVKYDNSEKGPFENVVKLKTKLAVEVDDDDLVEDCGQTIVKKKCDSNKANNLSSDPFTNRRISRSDMKQGEKFNAIPKHTDQSYQLNANFMFQNPPHVQRYSHDQDTNASSRSSKQFGTSYHNTFSLSVEAPAFISVSPVENSEFHTQKLRKNAQTYHSQHEQQFVIPKLPPPHIPNPHQSSWHSFFNSLSTPGGPDLSTSVHGSVMYPGHMSHKLDQNWPSSSTQNVKYNQKAAGSWARKPDSVNRPAKFVEKSQPKQPCGQVEPMDKVLAAMRHEVDVRLRDGIKLLIILRGCPGSGKTTLARMLKNKRGVILSTDDYFYIKDVYTYDVTKLGYAHEWNKKRARKAFEAGKSPVIIDNTNSQSWEIKPYIVMGQRNGYECILYEPPTPWKFKAKELAKRNNHGVPQERIQNMIDRYEHNLTVDKILGKRDFERKPAVEKGYFPREKNVNKNQNNVLKTESSSDSINSLQSETSLTENVKKSDDLNSVNDAVNGKGVIKLTNKDDMKTEVVDSSKGHSVKWIGESGSTFNLKIQNNKEQTCGREDSKDFQFNKSKSSMQVSGSGLHKNDQNDRVGVEVDSIVAFMTSAGDQQTDIQNGMVLNLDEEFEEYLKSDRTFEGSYWTGDDQKTQYEMYDRGAGTLHQATNWVDPKPRRNRKKREKSLTGSNVVEVIDIENSPLVSKPNHAEGQDSGVVNVSSINDVLSNFKTVSNNQHGVPSLKDIILSKSDVGISQQHDVLNTEDNQLLNPEIELQKTNVVPCLKDLIMGHMDIKQNQQLSTPLQWVSKNEEESRTVGQAETIDVHSVDEMSPASIRVPSLSELASSKVADGVTVNAMTSGSGFLYSSKINSNTKDIAEREGAIPKTNKQKKRSSKKMAARFIQPKLDPIVKEVLINENWGLPDFSSSSDSREPSSIETSPVRIIKRHFKESFSQTAAQDFTIEYAVSRQQNIATDGFLVLPCFPRYIATSEKPLSPSVDISIEGRQATCKESSHSMPYKMRLDKGCSTDDLLEPNLEDDVQFLHSCFPEVPLGDLTDILEKCHGNTQLAINNILDSGTEYNVPRIEEVDDKTDDNADGGDNGAQSLISPRQLSHLCKEHIIKCNVKPLVPYVDNSGDEGDQVFPLPRLESADGQKIEYGANGKTTKDVPVEGITKSKSRSFSGSGSLELKLDSRLAGHLQALFGHVTDSAESTSIPLSVGLAYRIHQAWKQSLQSAEPPNHKQLAQDEQLARILQAEEHKHQIVQHGIHLTGNHRPSDAPVTNLRQIMAEEKELEQWKQNELTSSPDSIAIRLKRQKLYETFPGIDHAAIEAIFQVNGCDLGKTIIAIRDTCGVDEKAQIVMTPEAAEDYQRQLDVQELSLVYKNEESKDYYQSYAEPDYEDYRGEATMHASQRQECFQKAQDAHRRGMKEVAVYYAQQGHLHTQKIREANVRASHKILERKNAVLTRTNAIDMHGLHVVESLEVLKQVLATRQEELALRPDKRKMFVDVITGRGNNSKGGQAKIRPAVIDYLKRNNFRFTQPDPGIVKVHF